MATLFPFSNLCKNTGGERIDNTIIETNDLTITFGGHTAVDSVSIFPFLRNILNRLLDQMGQEKQPFLIF